MNSRFEAVSFSTSSSLGRFDDEQKKYIQDRLQILSSLAYFIGKDHEMKVEVNPNKGWHWDFIKNVVRADPDDLLKKPIEFLRFVMSHEAGHRRISRVTGVVPDTVWRQPGFSFMMNAIEDPRDNNFVADTMPHFKDEMKFAYGEESEEAKFETEMQEEANKKFGKSPRFMQAGFEYIKLWYKVSTGQEPTLSEGLPDDVRDVVLKTYEAAKRSWNTYPSLKEADNGLVHQGKQLSGEEAITEYAKLSFELNYKNIWPLFKTLIDQDIEDAKNGGEDKKDDKGEQENHQEEEQNGQEGDQEEEDGNDGQGKDEKPEEGENGEANSDNQDNGEDKKGNRKKLTEEEAKKLIEDFAKKLADHFSGEKEKADSEKKARMAKFEPQNEEGDGDSENESNEQSSEEVGGEKIETNSIPKKLEQPFKIDDKAIEELKKKLEQKNKREMPYNKVLRECSPLIDTLTNELQEIFNKRRHTKWQAGYKSGKKIHIGKAIQEEVSHTSPFDTGAFMRREQPKEVDYAITLLVDLSGSMDMGGKIQEAFKASVVLSEVLNQIGVKFSVTGFNKYMYEYKNFDQEIDDDIRHGAESMLVEVEGYGSNCNDDAWALSETNKKMMQREERQKIIFVISDGQPVPSGRYPERDLSATVEKISKNGKVRVIGLGLGRGTEHVREYYPDSIANISVEELSKVLGKKLREVIEKGN